MANMDSSTEFERKHEHVDIIIPTEKYKAYALTGVMMRVRNPDALSGSRKT